MVTQAGTWVETKARLSISISKYLHFAPKTINLCHQNYLRSFKSQTVPPTFMSSHQISTWGHGELDQEPHNTWILQLLTIGWCRWWLTWQIWGCLPSDSHITSVFPVISCQHSTVAARDGTNRHGTNRDWTYPKASVIRGPGTGSSRLRWVASIFETTNFLEVSACNNHLSIFYAPWNAAS